MSATLGQGLRFAAAFVLALSALPGAGADAAAFDEEAFFRPGRDFVIARYAASAAQCKQGVPADCVRLSRRLPLATTNVEHDHLDEALSAGCAKAVPAACGARAWSRLSRNEGLVGQFLDDKKEIDKACTGGDSMSCSRLVEILTLGPPPVRDRARGKMIAADVCEKQGGYPCFNLAQIRLTDKVNADKDERDIALRVRACDGGDGYACLDVGQALADTDAAKAAESYRKGCDLEYHEACHNLGWATRDGKGVARDVAQGIALMELACRLGDAKACDDRASETHQYERYCSLWGASSCYLAAVALAKERGETAEVAEKLVALSMKAYRRGHTPALNVVMHLFKDYEVACNTDHRKADACAFAGIGYLVGWPGVDRFAQTPAAQKARALGYLRHSCNAGAKNMCAKADAVQAATK